MSVDTIVWDSGMVRIIDQCRLPEKLIYLEIDKLEDLAIAIETLQIRGAPAIGIAGAMGIVLGLQNYSAKDYEEFHQEAKKVIERLKHTRPTAINLFWALERMYKIIKDNKENLISIDKIKELLLLEALEICEEDKKLCRSIGHYGSALLEDNDIVLTHCNAGGLATSGYGTALAIIYYATEQGKKIKVYADETRPLWQGARLTTWELMQNNIDVTLISDNMAAWVMKEGRINKIIVGADRIASNGDSANKIGTYGLALLAKAHNIPFYIAAPFSTLDLSLKNGSEIPIEERNSREIWCPRGLQIAPENVKVYNPAFDVTPAELITAIITDKGIMYPPYDFS